MTEVEQLRAALTYALKWGIWVRIGTPGYTIGPSADTKRFQEWPEPVREVLEPIAMQIRAGNA